MASDPDTELYALAELRAPYLWVSDYRPGIGDKGEYTEDPRNVAEVILAAGFHHKEEGPEWEYGIANFGDLEDVIVHARGKEWAEGAVQPEYGDYIVRRRKAGPWEVVPDERP